MKVPTQLAIDFAESKLTESEPPFNNGSKGLQIEGLPFVVAWSDWHHTVPEKTLNAFREGMVLALARLFDEYSEFVKSGGGEG